METQSKIDFKWIVTVALLGVCIYLQYATMKRLPEDTKSNPLMQAILDNNDKIADLNRSIDSLDSIKATINNDINKNYNDYETYITNSYHSSDSIKFKYLAKDLDSMERLWDKGYYIRH